MASRVQGHIFTRPMARYPWEQWTDGDQWEIVKGEDYHISTYNMQVSLHGRARAQGLRVKTNSFTGPEALVFQFYEEEDE